MHPCPPSLNLRKGKQLRRLLLVLLLVVPTVVVAAPAAQATNNCGIYQMAAPAFTDVWQQYMHGRSHFYCNNSVYELHFKVALQERYNSNYSWSNIDVGTFNNCCGVTDDIVGVTSGKCTDNSHVYEFHVRDLEAWVVNENGTTGYKQPVVDSPIYSVGSYCNPSG